MWTKKAHFIVIYFRINRFRLPIAIPAFLLNSLVSELGDLVNFFTFFNAKITFYVNSAEDVIYSLTDFEKQDYVDIDVKSEDDKDKVKIKIYTR